MRTKCIQVRSVTYAQKAQDVLKHYGIHAKLSRQSGNSRYGCAWCVSVPYSQSETAYSLLQSNGIALTGEMYDLP